MLQFVDGTKNEFQKLVIQAQGDELLYYNLFTKIKNTPFKYMSTDKNIFEYSLYQIIGFILNKKVGKTVFIENKEDEIIAFISYYEREGDTRVIELVKIANFYMVDEKEKGKDYKSMDEGDVLADTLELMNNLLKKYEEINFSASIYNEKAIRSYDIFFKRHKGNPENRVQDGNEINWKLYQEK